MATSFLFIQIEKNTLYGRVTFYNLEKEKKRHENL